MLWWVGVFIDFLSCGGFLEMVIVVGEFEIVEFDVGIRYSQNGYVGLEASYENNVKSKVG